MKANEAPEKIYIQKGNGYKNIGYDSEWTPIPLINEDNVEYTRTDVFIEKVCEGIEHLLSGYIIRNFNFGDSYEMDILIEDIKNYMKGE